MLCYREPFKLGLRFMLQVRLCCAPKEIEHLLFIFLRVSSFSAICWIFPHPRPPYSRNESLRVISHPAE